MEHLWSPAGATGGNRWQMGTAQKRLRQAKTVAVGCDQLPESFHGKEGVDGSSPSEGFAISLQISPFRWRCWRRVWVSTSTERPPPCRIASAVAQKRRRDVASRSFGATSTQRPPPVRSRARRAGRRRVRCCRGRGGRSGGGWGGGGRP